jgi:hypothetical protein
METKICTKCNVEYPKTNEFFHNKIIKPSKKLRLINTCYSLRSICKNCWAEYIKGYKHKQRAKQLNITVKEYKKNMNNIFIQAIKKSNTKYTSYNRNGLSNNEILRNNKIIKMGYSIENYQNEWVLLNRKNKRKYNYEGIPLDRNLTSEEKIKIRREVLQKSVIANYKRIPVNEISEDLYKASKNLIILKRKLKNHEQPQICN